jgi:RNA ligase (TIGR02306 family)
MPLQYQLEAYKGFKYIKLLITSTIARIYGYIHAKIGNLCHRAYVCLPPAIGAFKPIALAYKHIRKLWRKIGAGKHVAAFQESNIYWTPYTIPEVRKLLENLTSMHGNDQVIIYGELYGPGIQKLTYGVDKLSFRAFDIMINGKYIDYSRFLAYCQMYGVPTCTELYYGPYKNIDNIKTFADGNTTLPNASHIREGVVVKAATEDTHPDVGRKILKYISNAYLAWKDGREDLDSTDI